MSARCTFATSMRVLRQLRRDPRTVVMLIVAPLLLLALMKGVFAGGGGGFQRVGISLVGVFPLVSMFLVTAVTMLRERTSGTLERLMTLPLGKLDLLLGYALAFGVIAIAQATAASVFAVAVLDLTVAGSLPLLVALAVLNALLGMALGLFVSAFARSEFQAVQFMPLLLLPQVFLSGLMAPRAAMSEPLQRISDVLPLTYALEALRLVAASDDVTGTLLRDVAIVAGVMLAALALGAATLRRRTA